MGKFGKGFHMKNNALVIHRLFSLLFSIFLLMPLWADSSVDYIFRHFSTEDGLLNNEVKACLRDRYGFLWIGTVSGLNRWDGYRLKTFENSEGHIGSIPEGDILSLQEDHAGDIWIEGRGEYAVYRRSKEKIVSAEDILKGYKIPTKGLRRIYIDDNGHLWVAVGKQLYYCQQDKGAMKVFYFPITPDIAQLEKVDNYFRMIDNQGRLFTLDIVRNKWSETVIPEGDRQANRIFTDKAGCLWVYSTVHDRLYFKEQGRNWQTLLLTNHLTIGQANSVRGISDDGNGHIWIATDHQGLFIYDRANGSQTNLHHDVASPTSLAENNIGCITIDKDHVLWVGYMKKGLSYYHPSFQQFSNFKSPLWKNVSSVYQDTGGHIWIGTDGYGLVNAYNNQIVSFPGNIAVTLMEDNLNRLWVGTYMNGLLCYKDGKLVKHYTKENSPLSDNSVYSLCQDKSGRIWIGTLWGWLQNMDPESDKWQDFRSPSNDESIAMDFFYDGSEEIYAGMLSGLCRFDIATGKRTLLTGNSHGKPFMQKDIQSVFRDKRGLFWLCHGQGVTVWDLQTDSLYYLNKRLGLCDNVTRGICEDQQGRIWIATSNGCSCIKVDRADDNRLSFSFDNYSTSDGLLDNNLSRHSICLMHDGNLLLGNSEGYSIIDLSSKASRSTASTHVVFTGLRLAGQPISVGQKHDGRIILRQPVEAIESIDLSYADVQIEIEFSSMNLLATDKVRYAYRMEGLTNEWIETTEGRVTFGSLRPGSYKLWVKVVGADEPPAMLNIRVSPPFWLSWPAYLLYALLIVAAIWYYLRQEKRRQQRRMEEQRKKIEQEQEIKMNEMKLRFFTNVSHDFRTPLTLILTPLQVMMKEEKDEKKKEKLGGIQRNADRLLKLVNQLLDFRKLDVGGEKLHTQPNRFVYFVTENAKAFNEFARERNITYQIIRETDEQTMMFDSDKILKVLTNLLSNAFKYTPDGGSITVSVNRVIDKMQVSVRDTGCGVADDDKPHIFERFYQTKQSYEKTGSGIGLHIVAQYVKMHGGHIEVGDNQPHGSVFTFTVPIVTASGREPTVEVTKEETPEADLQLEEGEKVEHRTTLLIAEDNAEFRTFLANQLADEYDVMTAENGKEALAQLHNAEVDIVISDIMMPEMDGVELCRNIKTDIQTSHIPVLMLTALSADEDRLRGLEQGADDYLTKPFNLDVLRLRLRKFLEWSRHAHREFKQKIDVSPSEITISSLDEQLIKKAIKAVEDNMINDYSVEDLASDVGLTRGHLYKKLMAITGKGPADFIRTIRMKRARQLLDDSGLQISEIAYTVGYSSPKIFSRNFKAEFGMTPSDYLNNKKES